MDGGSTLQTPLQLKARITSGREPCHCLLARHTPVRSRETLYLSTISLCSHTSPSLCQATGTRFQLEQKQHPLCLGVMVFPAFRWDSARGWMQWEASPAAGPLLAFTFLFPASISVYQLHSFHLSSWQADFF